MMLIKCKFLKENVPVGRVYIQNTGGCKGGGYRPDQ